MNDAYTGPRRWPWVLLVLGLVLLLVGFGGHWLWSATSARRLNAQVALYKAAGEPIEPGDFAVRGVGDGDNAAIDLRNAARSIDINTDTWKDYQKLDPALPLSEMELAGIRAAIAENQAAFDNLDIAMTKQGVDWKLPLKSPVIEVMLPDLHEQRQLASLVYHRALVSYQQGDHAAALRDLQRVEFIGDAVAGQTFLVGVLVASGIRAMVGEGAEKMSHELKIGNAPGDASPRQGEQLMAVLLDEADYRKAMRDGLLGERMSQLDVARCVADGTINLMAVAGGMGRPMPPAAQAVTLLARPIAYDDGLIMIRHTTAVMKAAERSANWPGYRAIAPPPPAVMRNRVRHILAAMMMPSLEMSVQTHYRAMTDRRMAAVALAIRRHRLDHAGALPGRLQDLVPHYLPAVPVDAMSSGAPLNYLPRADKPIVYSVGPDGSDDGGSEASTQRLPQPSRWNRQDAVMHLTRQPREAPAEEAPLSGVGAEELDLEEEPAATQPAATRSLTP